MSEPTGGLGPRYYTRWGVRAQHPDAVPEHRAEVILGRPNYVDAPKPFDDPGRGAHAIMGGTSRGHQCKVAHGRFTSQLNLTKHSCNSLLKLVNDGESMVH